MRHRSLFPYTVRHRFRLRFADMFAKLTRSLSRNARSVDARPWKIHGNRRHIRPSFATRFRSRSSARFACRFFPKNTPSCNLSVFSPDEIPFSSPSSPFFPPLRFDPLEVFFLFLLVSFFFFFFFFPPEIKFTSHPQVISIDYYEYYEDSFRLSFFFFTLDETNVETRTGE